MLQKSDHDMVNKINAASRAAMVGVIARARLRNATLVVSIDGEVVEVNAHDVELPSLTNDRLEETSGRSQNTTDQSITH
ncbi:MAG: hypothetical protein ACK58L_14405 [Planctomycetota bacterium]